AFYELDCSVPLLAYPPAPVAEQVHRWQQAALACAGVDVNTGMRLHQIFLAAGLAAPEMAVFARIGGSRPFVEELAAGAARTVRSLLPVLVKAGIATEQ